MIHAISNVLLLFAILSSSEAINPVNDYTEYDISNVSYQEKEVEWHREGLIGRHRLVKIDSLSNKGVKPIQRLTEFLDGGALTDFSFTRSVTMVKTASVSTETSFSSEIMTGLEVVAGIPNAEISKNKSSTLAFKIDTISTYTVSEEETFTVKFSVDENKVKDKIFALCSAANVYEVSWETWQYDDYWWGDYEVSGSRKSYTAYINYTPYVTVEDYNGNLL